MLKAQQVTGTRRSNKDKRGRNRLGARDSANAGSVPEQRISLYTGANSDSATNLDFLSQDCYNTFNAVEDDKNTVGNEIREQEAENNLTSNDIDT